MGKKSFTGQFLTEFKRVASGKRGIYVVPRLENREFLLRLGITEENQEKEILALTVEDYCEGPKRDRSMAGDVWIFGKKIREVEVYIKLKIAEVQGEKIARCLSFHKAKKPLNYPFKRKKKRTAGQK